MEGVHVENEIPRILVYNGHLRLTRFTALLRYIDGCEVITG